MWTDPGDVSARDLRYGPGGEANTPQPPFQFVEEDLTGTSSKVKITDAQGRKYNVKFGPEARPSAFSTHLISALGYYAEDEYLITHGQLMGVKGLKRAKEFIGSDGTFTNGRFQLRTSEPKYLEHANWTWNKNPFTGTPQLKGLKILMILVSNWDAKDARNVIHSADGGGQLDSNLAVFEDNSTGTTRLLFADIDWGASMGKWGGVVGRSKWDCKGFLEQTPDFIKGVDHGWVDWGYEGKHRKDIADDINMYDVMWLMQYLGKITDEQIRRNLAASGATPDEMDCYMRSFRERIGQLQKVADQAAAAQKAAYNGSSARP